MVFQGKGCDRLGISLSDETMDMLKVILKSNLRPIEKLFLTIEWFFRERKPYELFGARLIDLQRKAKTLMKNQIPSDLRREAFKEAAEIFQIEGEKKLFSLLFALSYYSYIVNEVVYDHDARKELLSKLLELGFRPSQIHNLSTRWTEVTGSPEELFNKIFRK